MSEFASVVEQARRAFASVSKLESLLTHDPTNVALQVNLTATVKLARKSEEQLRSISAYQRVDLCNYRLVAQADRSFVLHAVSRSLLEYQNLFSQIYDAIKNGIKGRAQVGSEAAAESAMELAYTYSGSLGFVLLAHSDRDFFEGKLDRSIAAMFDIMQVKRRAEIREVASAYGTAVVKRLHDWSKANLDGHFSADVRWQRSDGQFLGHFVQVERLGEIVDLIVDAGDESRTTHQVVGRLVGGDLSSGTFHFVVPNGEDYRGQISDSFPPHAEMLLGKSYGARILETSNLIYATENIQRRYYLEALWEPKGDPAGALPSVPSQP